MRSRHEFLDIYHIHMNSFYKKIRNLSLAHLAIIGILVAASSCKYDEVLPREVEVPTETVSYELDIQPFFEAKCVSCHSGGIPPNLEASVSYNELLNNGWLNVEDPANSALYISIELGGSMENYATPEERALVLAWITQGAENN